MKTIILIVVGLIVGASLGACGGATIGTNDDLAVLAPMSDAAVVVPYRIVERGPHLRRWQSVTAITNRFAPAGRARPMYRTNSYVELATGLHARDAAGHWIDASPRFEPQLSGGALAARTGHPLYLPSDLFSDALRCTLPDGSTLVSRPLGLAYSDGNRAVLIAPLRSGAAGQLLAGDIDPAAADGAKGSNDSTSEALYTNICDGVQLDLLVRNHNAGYESDLVIREQLPDPTQFGFTNAAAVRVQWWTEFFDPPTPARRVERASDGAIDERLRFGEMTMGRGRAYLIDSKASDDPGHRTPVPVTKRWVQLEGRTFLVEELPLTRITRQLAELPVRTGAQVVPVLRSILRAAVRRVPRRWFDEVLLPAEETAEGGPARSRYARADGDRSESGFTTHNSPLILHNCFSFADSLIRSFVQLPFHSQLTTHNSQLPARAPHPGPLPEGEGVTFADSPFTTHYSQLILHNCFSFADSLIRSFVQLPFHSQLITLNSQLPPFRPPRRGVTPLLVAQTRPERIPGFLVDYTLVSSIFNFRFQSDTTYYVTNAVDLTEPIIEGGAVIKFKPGSPAVLNLFDQITCLTAPYHPAVFTVADDNSIGEIIPGSTGVPVKAGQCIHIESPGDATDLVLDNLRFAHFDHAFSYGSHSIPALIRNSQFVDCTVPLHIDGNTSGEPTLQLRNVLAAGCARFIEGYTGPEILTEVDILVSAEHLTVHNCDTLTWQTYGISDLRLTNCLLAAVTNWGNFYGITTNQVAQFTGDTGVFEPVGGAGHYLAANSPFRNAGTTNINPALLASLANKTTSPPLVFYNQILSNNLAFTPQAARDTGVPDLGYHYDPLDYALGQISFQNANVTVAPGTVLATFATSPGYYGFALASGANFVCIGAPTNLNRIVRCNQVQEHATTNWNFIGESVSGPWLAVNPAPVARFRFTEFSMAAQETCHFRSYFWEPLLISFADCRFNGGQLQVQGALAATNNLFERALLSLNGVDAEFDLAFRNNLFVGGRLECYQEIGGTWSFKDNLFDHAALAQNGAPLEHGYNGYLPGSDRLTPTNATDVAASVTWQTGPLGNYYQATNSPFVDRGSVTNAGLAGLFHHTTATSQVKEGASRVDIGLHYIALDANGNPLDTDGDGIPDYLEDANNDGLLTLGETPFGITIENPVNGAIVAN